MHTKYLKINDNCTIAYDVTGEGPALIMLHSSLPQSRQVWHKLGYVEKFSENYKVITVDFPCHGESTCEMLGIKDFSIQFIVEIIDIITQECNVKNYAVIGLAFGGAVAMHLSVESNRVTGIIVDDPACFDRLVKQSNEFLPRLIEVRKASEEDSIDLPDLKKNLPFSNEVDLNVAISLYEAIKTWKNIKPKDINCPMCYLDESTHTTGVFEEPPKIASVYDEMEKFLKSLRY